MKRNHQSLISRNTSIILLVLMIPQIIWASQSGKAYRRSSVHNGNLVRTVYGNWGVIGQPSNKG
ncbi:MAG: hypothetical protein WCY30_07285, partial [Candidatus Neomarinimicrobiota bacterium]